MSHQIVTSNPITALVVMLSHLSATVVISELNVPLIFMQIFQLVAFTITITVGVITIYKFFKNKNNE
jgi:hypothetical protein